MKAIHIPVPSKTRIKSRMEATQRGFSMRFKCRPAGLDKFFSSRLTDKDEAAAHIREQIENWDKPTKPEPAKVDVQPVRSNSLHNWREIFALLDDNSDNGETSRSPPPKRRHGASSVA